MPINNNNKHNIIGQPVTTQEKKLEGIEKKQKLVRIIITIIGIVLIVLGIVLYFILRK